MANKSSQHSQYFAAFAAAFGAMAHSTAATWASPTGPTKLNDLQLTKEQLSWVRSTLIFAAGSTCIFTGFLTNFIGRKKAMLLLVIPFTFGWMLIIFTKNFSMVIVGRALLGFSTGGVCVFIPIYIAEIAEPHIRGILCSLFQLLSTVGTLIVFIGGDYISTSRLTVICAAIPLIFGVLVVFCPESPTYLMQTNRPDDASRALLWLRGRRYNPSNELKAIRLAVKQPQLQHRNQQQTEQQHQQQQSQKQRKGVLSWPRKHLQPHQYKEVVKSAVAAMFRQSSAKALSISYGLFICQQMCGINILVFYTTSIFAIAGVQLSPDLSTAAISVVATFVSTLILDRFGRRNLLLTSQVVVTICTFTLGYYFRMATFNPASVGHLNWLPLSMLCLFTIAFSIGLGPVPWVMLGELFPPDIKGLAGSISTSSNLTLAFISTTTFGSLREVFGCGGVLWLYACFSLLGAVFVYCVVPETMGKSLNNIQRMINEVEDVQADSGAEQLVESGDIIAMKQLRRYHKKVKSFTL